MHHAPQQFFFDWEKQGRNEAQMLARARDQLSHPSHHYALLLITALIKFAYQHRHDPHVCRKVRTSDQESSHRLGSWELIASRKELAEKAGCSVRSMERAVGAIGTCADDGTPRIPFVSIRKRDAGLSLTYEFNLGEFLTPEPPGSSPRDSAANCSVQTRPKPHPSHTGATTATSATGLARSEPTPTSSPTSEIISSPYSPTPIRRETVGTFCNYGLRRGPKLKPYLGTFDAPGIMAYLRELQRGPWVELIAQVVGLNPQSEAFELAFLAWGYCCRRQFEAGECHSAVGTFISNLYGRKDHRGRTWNLRPRSIDEENASRKLREMRRQFQEVT